MAYKLLLPFVMPMSLVAILAATALLLGARGKRKAALSIGTAALALFLACSTPWLPDLLARSLERRYPAVSPAASPGADAVVILGGALAPAYPPRLGEELTESSNRILQASRLFRAGKAPIVVVSAGNLPWSAAPRPEAAGIAALLEEWGVPRPAIVLEERSRTTRENAVETARILRVRGVRRVLLVTSAMHMPRAVGAFAAVGLEVIPSPTDFTVADSGALPVVSWLPSAGSVQRLQSALWEVGGRLVYRMRGWSR